MASEIKLIHGGSQRIGRFALDTKRMALTARDREISLRPKVFHAIRCLIAQEGRASREALAQAIWMSRSGAPTNPQGNALDQIMTDVRRVLREIGEVSLLRDGNGF